jgi:DNA-binding CsgD family transcriptional regulator
MRGGASAEIRQRLGDRSRVPIGGTHLDITSATAVFAALGLAREHGGAAAALRAAGSDLPDATRCEGLRGEIGELLGRPASGDAAVGEALALGFLAGRIAHRPRTRMLHDPTTFVMDQELVVQAAEGESIMRLPWFDDGLFVGRQLPDISEMPGPLRKLCVENYSAALAGERGRFAFTSYGHAYSVDAVPVRGDDGRVEVVLAIATPTGAFASAAMAYETMAKRLERSATQAAQRAERHRLAGRRDAEAAQIQAAHNTRQAAERARANARRLRARDTGAPVDPPWLTPRETEVLSLASHGLTYADIADQLAVTAATVRTHLRNVYSKLGAGDKAGAVAAALRHNLIE